MVPSPGTPSPLSQRSAVRLISVRRFACAYVCVCVCASGAVWHFPCRSRLPVPAAVPHIQAGRQADLPASEPSSPPASPASPRRGCPALQHSAEFLSSLISRVLCVCVCVPMHIVFSLPLFFSPLTACFARWLKFASQ